MEDDVPMIHSPLEQTIAQDGLSVQIFIYRAEHEPGWLLEVEDQLGGSTVWEDRFPDDSAALKEALEAIRKDGIASFTVSAETRSH